MAYPEHMRFSQDHEWVAVEDAVATIGITEYAADQLGDIVYVDLPSSGDEIVAGDAFGEVESVKSVSELISPISGEVLAVNDALGDSPETVNADALGEGWMVRVLLSDTDELDELMDAAAYLAFIGS